MPIRETFTLADMIENNAHKYPNEPAFRFADRRLTHAEFAERARRLASAWHLRGLRRQDRISILSQNRLEFYEVYGAGELAGYITGTVNWRLAPPEMAYVIRDTAPKVLIFEEQYAETVAALRPQLDTVEHYVCIDGDVDFAERFEDVVASGSPDGPPFRATPDDIAYLIYTSGTTGKPKGVILGQREELAAAEILGSDMRCYPDDRFLLMMPLFHIGAKILQIAQHWRAGYVVQQQGFDPEAVLRTIQEEQITITHMAPTMIQTLIESPAVHDYDVSSLRMVVYAAAPMPLPVLRRALEIFGPIFQHQYGQTEGPGTTLLCHQHRPDGTERDRELLTSVGQPSPTVRLRIVDDEARDLATGEVGEILIQSAAMMRGYWNNTVATIETRRDDWIHTGDIGRLDEEGYLYLVDRKKDMIISGGENIYSREVEEALVKHAAVSEAAVIGVPDEKWGEAVKAVVVLRAESGATAEELIEHCKTLIASYKKPKHLVFTDELPKVPSGKVNKVRLRELFGAGGDPTPEGGKEA
ncbi:MAG: long-chain-fatty-acid--CoA ligase [Alphaproteobacteria bacterium]|nr:long-chain-fatty-acid--CoA ligase [Alphaproteobacteria bacterium]